MTNLIYRAKLMVRCFNFNACFDGRYVYASGVHAKYRRLDSKWGMKFFADKGHRDWTYRVHLILAKHGFGPEMGPKFTSVNENGIVVHGYLIEHVKVLSYADNWDYDVRKEFTNKVKAILPRDVQLTDLHSDNIGWKGEKHVIIDCSCSGFKEEDSLFYSLYDDGSKKK